MRIVLHGEPITTRAADIGALVDERVGDRRGVAVAVDGRVVPRADWDDTPLTEGTRVELVGAVQGG